MGEIDSEIPELFVRKGTNWGTLIIISKTVSVTDILFIGIVKENLMVGMFKEFQTLLTFVTLGAAVEDSHLT